MSAVDHYKVPFLRRQLESQREESEAAGDTVTERENVVEGIAANLSEAQDELQGAVATFERAMKAVAETEAQIESAAARVAAAAASAVDGPDQADDILDPRTGLSEGEKFPLSEEQKVLLEKMVAVRQHMERGDVESAREAEMAATKLSKKVLHHFDPRVMALPDAFQVPSAEFVDPWSTPDEEELSRSFMFARERRQTLGENSRSALLQQLMSSEGFGSPPHLEFPKGVNHAIVREIRSHQLQLAKFRIERRKDENSDSDEDDQDTDGGGLDEEELNELNSPPSVWMDDKAWDAVETAVRNRIARSKEQNKTELAPPHASSARLARYNPKAHFGFLSEVAASSVDPLHDAMVKCKLRSQPDWSKDRPRLRRPFEYSLLGAPSDFDVDGDMMAMCGDLAWDELRDTRTHVAFGTVPYPVNLEASESLSELRDAAGSSKPWDSIPAKFCFKETRKQRTREVFTGCAADEKNGIAWASSSSTGTIHGFSTADGMERKQRPLALLAFGEDEVKAQSKYCNGWFPLACCGDVIVGTGGTGSLSVWNISQALQDFPGPDSINSFKEKGATEEGSSLWDSDSDSEDDNDNGKPEAPAQKKQKTTPYVGLQPKLVSVEEKGFSCSDVEWLGGSQVLVAPHCSDTRSVRLFDLASESVVGLFCGTQGRVMIGKQHCAESHGLIFTMSGSGSGYAFDTRTYQPAFAVHPNHLCTGILGVPASSPVAFTYGEKSESIECWDLRMPASHAYTMSTGNMDVSSLFWHSRSASLVAAAKSDHFVQHGRARGYMYGEALSMEEEEELSSFDWYPRGAKHERAYFGQDDWHCDRGTSTPQLLMYMFEDGRKTE